MLLFKRLQEMFLSRYKKLRPLQCGPYTVNNTVGIITNTNNIIDRVWLILMDCYRILMIIRISWFSSISFALW